MIIIFFVGLFFIACTVIGTMIGTFLGGLELVGTIKGYDLDEDGMDDEFMHNG